MLPNAIEHRGDFALIPDYAANEFYVRETVKAKQRTTLYWHQAVNRICSQRFPITSKLGYHVFRLFVNTSIGRVEIDSFALLCN